LSVLCTTLHTMNVDRVLRLQAGIISRGQALVAGLSPDQIDRRLAARRWFQVHPTVYLAGDHEFTDEARVRAAALWAGELTTVSGLAAAWWHRLRPDPPTIVEVTSPTRRYLRPRPGVRGRRSELAAADRVATRGLWVTSLPLTVSFWGSVA
jgi:hypothetical protein